MTHALNAVFHHSYIAGGRWVSAVEHGALGLLGHLLRSGGIAAVIGVYHSLAVASTSLGVRVLAVFFGLSLLAPTQLNEVVILSRSRFFSFCPLMDGGGPKSFMLVIRHALIKAV